MFRRLMLLAVSSSAKQHKTHIYDLGIVNF